MAFRREHPRAVSVSHARDPFCIEAADTLPFATRAAIALARPLLSWALALETYRTLYDRAQRIEGTTFWTRALRTLDIRVDVLDSDLERIPDAGPLIVAANHPHGILDGLVLADMVYRRRSDVRVLTNHLVARIPELRRLCLFVDPFDGRRAAARNCAGAREALRWLDDGGALIVFPAGAVAHERMPASDTPIDGAWRDGVGRLALRSSAAVVPAYIVGRNSDWFYRAGRIHPALGTVLLARELLRQRGSAVTIRLGRAISASADAPPKRATTSRVTAQVRDAVERLRQQTDTVESEVRRLGPQARLLRGGSLEVFCAKAPEIPGVLQEIGRLREVTFRAVGEGTGQAIDLDRFDRHYLHLFVWNHDTHEVVGAYRIGLADEILSSHGVSGLYTSTLFQYDARLIARMAPAIELGRSFVRAEYQRSNALLLLWKGIAAFVIRSHRYRVLFGPVSISSRYADSSQQLLRAFLKQNFYQSDLGPLVAAFTPPADRPLPSGIDPQVLTDVRDVDRMVAALEADGKGIPVLLRQYLKLNAKLLGFNVDPAFGDALDALMMVDLANVEPAILARYFGREKSEQLLARLGVARTSRAAA